MLTGKNAYKRYESRYVELVRYVELGGPLYKRPCTAKSALTPGGGRVQHRFWVIGSTEISVARAARLHELVRTSSAKIALSRIFITRFDCSQLIIPNY